MEKQLLQEPTKPFDISATPSRRKFLGLLGLSGLALTLTQLACKKENINNDGSQVVSLDFGNKDSGLLNYALVMAHVFGAFYNKALSNPYPGMVAEERSMMEDIRDHYETQRAFYTAYLGDAAFKRVDSDFDFFNYASRDVVLEQAKNFADKSAAAYNGLAKLFTNTTNLMLAAKIASVEARHAAAIRDMQNYGSFADGGIISLNGLDQVITPMEMIAYLDPFVKNNLDASSLPTS